MVGRGLRLPYGRHAVLASAPVGIATKQVFGFSHQVIAEPGRHFAIDSI